MTPENRSHRPIPGRRPLRSSTFSLLVALFAVAATPALAQQGWFTTGQLELTDPTFHRPYLFAGQCQLSSVGSMVRFDTHELSLVDPVAPTQLGGNLCAGTTFDSVLLLYQRPGGAAGGFDPADPCANLVDYGDDFCGTQSAFWINTLSPGFVTVVVTAYQNSTELGPYTLSISSTDAEIASFIFYSGFELGDTGSWSTVLP